MHSLWFQLFGTKINFHIVFTLWYNIPRDWGIYNVSYSMREKAYFFALVDRVLSFFNNNTKSEKQLKIASHGHQVSKFTLKEQLSEAGGAAGRTRGSFRRIQHL